MVHVTYSEMVREVGLFNSAERRIRHDQVS